MQKQYSLVWLRRDLRLQDNRAISEALHSNLPLLFYFNFDTDILHQLENRSDSRLTFIHDRLEKLNSQLQKLGSGLIVKHGPSVPCFLELLSEYPIAKSFANKDYESFAIQRDQRIQEICNSNAIDFLLFKDHVIFEKDEILKKDGKPYTIYTPYMKKWRETFNREVHKPLKYSLKREHVSQIGNQEIPSLQSLGFNRSGIVPEKLNLSDDLFANYQNDRDYPALNASSNLAVHLRFGTLGIREVIQKIPESSPQFLNELIWREFFMQILANYPQVERNCFKAKYENIAWINNEKDFKRWRKGTTGFPLVDAGMRELLQTGSMHNRVRMITASFLCKHLLIDWRWGEAWFANHLLDYDLAVNNGNWQWVAGCGCDAAPYFRIFNPTAQQKKIDPDFKYIRKWIPEFGTSAYPKPMIDHGLARKRALSAYQKAVNAEIL